MVAAASPLAEVGCLCLVNHELRDQLKGRFWPRLFSANEHEQRIEFFRLLCKDWPEFFACQHCLRLHRRDGMTLPNWSSSPRRPRCFCRQEALGWGNLHGGAEYHLRFPHIHLAVSRHLFGLPHGIDLQSFSYTEIVGMIDDEDALWNRTKLSSFEARVVSGQLVLRTQQWTAFHEDLVELGDLDASIRVFFCPHHSVMLHDLEFIYSESATHPELRYAKTLQCTRCDTQVQLGTERLRHSNMVAMVITKWLNLGSGRSFDRWSRHLSTATPPLNFLSSLPLRQGPLFNTVKINTHSELQSWAAEFETMAVVPVRALRQSYGPYVLRLFEERMVEEHSQGKVVRKAGSMVDVANALDNYGPAVLVSD